MHVDIQKLKGRIVEKGKTQQIVAQECGMNRDTFTRKIKSKGESFSMGEVFQACESLGLTREEAVEIFFAE